MIKAGPPNIPDPTDQPPLEPEAAVDGAPSEQDETPVEPNEAPIEPGETIAEEPWYAIVYKDWPTFCHTRRYKGRYETPMEGVEVELCKSFDEATSYVESFAKAKQTLKNPEVVYAVFSGREPGMYKTRWEAEQQTVDYDGGLMRAFSQRDAKWATAYVQSGRYGPGRRDVDAHPDAERIVHLAPGIGDTVANNTGGLYHVAAKMIKVPRGVCITFTLGQQSWNFPYAMHRPAYSKTAQMIASKMHHVLHAAEGSIAVVTDKQVYAALVRDKWMDRYGYHRMYFRIRKRAPSPIPASRAGPPPPPTPPTVLDFLETLGSETPDGEQPPDGAPRTDGESPD